MEYTQEQLDKIIADAKTEAKIGLFTEEDLSRRVTSEVDRRVESGIQKGLETQRAKWEKEYKEKENLSAEELAAKKVKEMQDTMTVKEREINVRANAIDARDLLSNAGIPKAHYEKVVGLLVTDDSESTKSNVEAFISSFTEMKNETETKLKAEFTKVPPPNSDPNVEKVTNKSEFNKLSYAQKITFKESNPELYKTFIN